MDQVWAYIKVGVVNAAFGYGLYAALIFVRLDAFVAQLIAHIAGTALNYFMFRRHVFKDSRTAVLPYLGTYALNYGLSLAVLAGLKQILTSNYLAGLISIIIVTSVNFFALKFLVFLPKTQGR